MSGSAFPVIAGSDGILEYQSGTSYQAGRYVERDLIIYKSKQTTSTTFVPSEWQFLFVSLGTKIFYVDGNNNQNGNGTIFSPYKTLDLAVNRVIGSGTTNSPEIEKATIVVAGAEYTTGINLLIKDIKYEFNSGANVNYTGTSYLFDGRDITSGTNNTVIGGMGTFKTSTGGIVYNQGGGSLQRNIVLEAFDVISTVYSNDEPNMCPVIISEDSGSTVTLNIFNDLTSVTQHNIRVNNFGSLILTRVGTLSLLPTGITSSLPSQLLIHNANDILIDETILFSSFDAAVLPENQILIGTGGTSSINSFLMNNVAFRATNDKPPSIIDMNGLTVNGSFIINNSGFIGDVTTTYFIDSDVAISNIELFNVNVDKPNNNVTLSTSGAYNVLNNQFSIDNLLPSASNNVMVRNSDGTVGVNSGIAAVETLQDITDSGNTTTNNVRVLGDACVTWGSSDELAINYDGSDANINTISGGVVVNSTTCLDFKVNGGENAIVGLPNSCVELSYDNSAKIKTITNGICVFGCGFATNFISTSDSRLKYDLENIDDPIELTMGLCAKRYSMCGSQDKHIGFVAQDVEKIIPDVVTENKVDGDYYKVIGMETIKGIKYDNIIPILTEAIKEQQILIKKLENRITLLENR